MKYPAMLDPAWVSAGEMVYPRKPDLRGFPCQRNTSVKLTTRSASTPPPSNPERMDDRAVLVLIVGTVRLFRDGLSRVLSRDNSICVVGTMPPPDASGSLPENHSQPAVIIVDHEVARKADIVHHLAARWPQSKILAIGIGEDDAELLGYAHLGISGMLTREASATDLFEFVRRADRGEFPCSPTIASILLRHASRTLSSVRGTPSSPLTPREIDVVNLIDCGMGNKEIAIALSIEVATAKNHVHRILEKLGVRTRSAAVTALALSNLVPLNDLVPLTATPPRTPRP